MSYVDGKLESFTTTFCSISYSTLSRNLNAADCLIFSGMESTSCDRRVYLNQYMNTSHYLIFDGTIGQLHTKFHEEKVGRSYVVKETPNRMYTYYQN